METLPDRLQKFFSHKKLNSLRVSEQLGYSSSEKISRIFRKEGANPSVAILQDVANKFEELNMNWLFTGKGLMIKNNYEETFTPINIAADDGPEWLNDLIEKKIDEKLKKSGGVATIRNKSKLKIKKQNT